MGPIKIIGTVGPASISTKILKQLKNEGLDSFRINLSHSNTKSIKDYCETLRSAGIQPSLDTQGAQVRIENLTRREFNEIGEEIIIADHNANIRGDKYDISINHREFFSQIENLLKEAVSGNLDSFIDFANSALRSQNCLNEN